MSTLGINPNPNGVMPGPGGRRIGPLSGLPYYATPQSQEEDRRALANSVLLGGAGAGAAPRRAFRGTYDRMMAALGANRGGNRSRTIDRSWLDDGGGSGDKGGDGGLNEPDLGEPEEPGGSVPGGVSGGGSGAGGGGSWKPGGGSSSDKEEKDSDGDSGYTQPINKDPFDGVSGGASGGGDSVTIPTDPTGWIPPEFFKDNSDGDKKEFLDLLKTEYDFEGDDSIWDEFQQWLDEASDGGLLKDGARRLTDLVADFMAGKLPGLGAEQGVAISPTVPGMIGGAVGGEFIRQQLQPHFDRGIADFYNGAPRLRDKDDLEKELMDKDYGPSPERDDPYGAFEPSDRLMPDEGYLEDELREMEREQWEREQIDKAKNHDNIEIPERGPVLPDDVTLVPERGSEGNVIGWKVVPNGEFAEFDPVDIQDGVIRTGEFWGEGNGLGREVLWGDGAVTREYISPEGEYEGGTALPEGWFDDWAEDQERQREEEERQREEEEDAYLAMMGWNPYMLGVNPWALSPVRYGRG